MIHGVMVTIAIAVAMVWRWQWSRRWMADGRGWQGRWRSALGAFVVPPLLLANSALAILLMGRHCAMVGPFTGNVSHAIALGVLASAMALVAVCVGYLRRDLQRVRAFPERQVAGDRVRVAPVDVPYAAALGGWRAEVLVTAGAIAQLQPETLAAVLAHEWAHVTYRDPFWFFWLGWLRRLTGWLPYTEALWQELKVLRELRADRRAAATVDPLTLADALITLARCDRWQGPSDRAIAMVGDGDLSERVNALLDPTLLDRQVERLDWRSVVVGSAITLLPFVSLLYHRGGLQL